MPNQIAIDEHRRNVRRQSRPRLPSGATCRHVASLVLCVGCCLTGILPVHGGDDWPTFQNGGRTVIPNGSIPAKWSPESNVAWSVPIPGYGQSSPVVWKGQVYVTSVSGPRKDTYHVTAFRLSDGTKLWQYDVKNATPHENGNYVSKAAPTPAADVASLVCFFEGGNLLALTHEGTVRWQRNLIEEFGPIDSRHGLAASIEQDELAAYVWVERAEKPYVLCLDKRTGKQRWQVPGLGTTSWASPRLVPTDDAPHLVLSGIGQLVGLDPQTGKRLWTFTGISGNSTPTPVPVGNGRFLIGATVGREGGNAGAAAQSNGLITLQKEADGQWSAKFRWQARRATCSFGSPVAYQGLAYFVNRSGVLYGLDLESGEERFAERISESIWATPIAVGDKLYFFGKSGSTDVVAAGAQFRKLGTFQAWKPENAESNPQGGPVLYAAVASDGHLLLRRGDSLVCVAPSSKP